MGPRNTLREVGRVGLVAVKTWLGPADVDELHAEARSRGVSVAEVLRQALQEHLARRAEHRVLPLLSEALAPHIDRLAALITKAIVTAGVAAWEVNYLIGLEPKSNATVMMRASLARAVLDLRRKGVAVGEASEEEYTAAEERAGLPPVKHGGAQ